MIVTESHIVPDLPRAIFVFAVRETPCRFRPRLEDLRPCGSLTHRGDGPEGGRTSHRNWTDRDLLGPKGDGAALSGPWGFRIIYIYLYNLYIIIYIIICKIMIYIKSCLAKSSKL